MQNQLEFLKQLQAIDSAVRKSENIKLEFPIKLQQIEKEFERRKQRLEEERAFIEEIKKERRIKEEQLRSETERLRKSQEKILSVNTNKEYHAVLKEIEDIKRSTSDVETDILVCMEKMDDVAHELKIKEAEQQEWMKEFKEKKEIFASEIEKADQGLEKQQKLRTEMVEKIDSGLIQKYEKLREKREGLAVVPIQDGLCQGCNMNIPPQRFLEIRKNSNTIINCPFCSRILYFEEDLIVND